MFLETRMKNDNTGVYIPPKKTGKGEKRQENKNGVSEFIQTATDTPTATQKTRPSLLGIPQPINVDFQVTKKSVARPITTGLNG